jgi:pantoate--beta-alanine ligase
VREPDGLALSSRNVYLSSAEREQALLLNRSLILAEELISAGESEAETVVEKMRAFLAQGPLVRLEYAAVVDPDTLEPVTTIDSKVLGAVAAFVGKTRLIDNRLIGHRD